MRKFHFYVCLSVIILISKFSMASSIPEYMGDQTCKDCHLKEHQQWSGSHHDLAMQEANNLTVSGNFNNQTFSKDGISSTFYKDNDRFMVRTDGPDGKLHDYEVSYTFGVYPLQQYMVKFPEGKIQVLDIAWDSRSQKDGGQRWFSLHPNESIKAGDVLHWTGPNLNWNYMCADCHSTNLKKNYDEINKTYNSQWDSINVSCEACHGPASEHLAWTRNPDNQAAIKDKGLTINFPVIESNQWTINNSTGKPQLIDSKQNSKTLAARAEHIEVEQCAKCHSRRAQLSDKFVPGDNFRDHYLPSLLTESLYYPDGKIKDEVYVYGSFKQSLMYEAGVTCSDCHNAHTLELKAKGDNVCKQCHLANSYASGKHHFHQDDSSGASCIACHMPAKIYMGVDERNDHSFRIPRPDLAAQFDMPDACTNCHKGQTSQWAATAIKKWYGDTPQGYQQFGLALHGLDSQSEDALSQTYELFFKDTPDIAKATAIGYLGEYPSRQTLMTSLQMLRSKDADIRRQALLALQSFPIQHTAAQIFPRLSDPVKTVRLEAARILAGIPRGSLAKEQKDLLDKVIEEYRQSLLFNAERPESQLALAQLYIQLEQVDKAQAAFKEALRLQPQFIPAYINYASFLQQNDEAAAFELLQSGLKQAKEASLYHSLGLWYIRNKDQEANQEKAMTALKTATELEPENAHYQYVYAIAIAQNDPKLAIQILENALQNHRGNLNILTALASYYQQLSDSENANKYSKKANKVLQAKH